MFDVLNKKIRTVDLPFALRLYGVSDELFDELVDEDTKAELIDGVMVVHSPASPHHNAIAGFLRHLMDDYAQEKDLGAIFGPDDLIKLKARRRFSPDAFFLPTALIPEEQPREQFVLTPPLVVEVLSPSNSDTDLLYKRPRYHKAGVAELWIVDPDAEEVVIDCLQGKRYKKTTYTSGRVVSTVLTGFWIDVAWLWQYPLPRKKRCLREILRS